jgi:hypothetical protein
MLLTSTWIYQHHMADLRMTNITEPIMVTRSHHNNVLFFSTHFPPSLLQLAVKNEVVHSLQSSLSSFCCGNINISV